MNSTSISEQHITLSNQARATWALLSEMEGEEDCLLVGSPTISMLDSGELL